MINADLEKEKREIMELLSEIEYPLEFNPQEWKQFLRANCYAYALGLKIDEGILIGDIIGKRMTNRNSDRQEHINVLKEELEELGFEVYTCDYDDVLDEGFQKIFIEWNVVNEYHFYRQDADGRWSHKAQDKLPLSFRGFTENAMQFGECFCITKF